MPAKKKPFRVLRRPPYEPTHFTYEEALQAVVDVMLERGELTEERAKVLLDRLGQPRNTTDGVGSA